MYVSDSRELLILSASEDRLSMLADFTDRRGRISRENLVLQYILVELKLLIKYQTLLFPAQCCISQKGIYVEICIELPIDNILSNLLAKPE